MQNWRDQLKSDPVPPLIEGGDEALRYWVRHDLLGEDAGPVQCLWELPAVRKILRKQLPDGSWPRSGVPAHVAVNYPLIETWRQFRFLVEQYGLTREHPRAARAAEFLFSCQTKEGDIRGFLANQYATYYTGAILALLIQAGYSDDSRIEKGFRWLLAMRQTDGGWTIPILTRGFDRATMYRLTSQWAEPVEPDRSRPFSHHWTGMVLRAFAVHPVHRHSEEAKRAAGLLKSRFFQPDVYTSYRAASYWVRFEYPFWWNHLVAALDSLSRIGLNAEDADMKPALDWLADHQEADGLWKTDYSRPENRDPAPVKDLAQRCWISLAICRVLRRFYG